MPADFATENGKVRYNIGDITEPYIISDAVIDTILGEYAALSVDLRIWKTTVAVLKMMKAQFAIESDRSREREGGVEVEQYYTKRYERVCDLLDEFLNDPVIDPDGKKFAGIIFGGVSREEVARVEDDPDSNGPGAKIEKFSVDLDSVYELDTYWKRYG